MKKRILIFLIILAVSVSGVFAQDAPEDLDFDLKSITDAFGGFAGSVASALPMASTVGLQWSDAYIGNLPHLGVGVAVGFASLPFADMQTALSSFLPEGENPIDELAPMLDQLGPLGDMIGFPFPAAAVDLRLGGIILPFDIGFKIGFIPDQVYGLIGDATNGLLTANTLDYFIIGGDIRYALVKEPKGFSLIPDIMIGGGYNYYRGKFAFPMPDLVIDTTIPIPDPTTIGLDKTMTTNDWRITNADSEPAIGFGWESHVIDVKAQISKKILLLFTPYIGAGASYSRSKAGGGLYSAMTVEKEGQPSSFADLNAEIEGVKEAVDDFGDEASKIPGSEGFTEELEQLADIEIPTTNDGFLVNKWVNGWGFRAFGGLSINIWVLKIDTSVMYDIIGKSLGAQVGVRLQF